MLLQYDSIITCCSTYRNVRPPVGLFQFLRWLPRREVTGCRMGAVETHQSEYNHVAGCVSAINVAKPRGTGQHHSRGTQFISIIDFALKICGSVVAD